MNATEKSTLMGKIYRVNEIFYSLQGEGMRSGEPSVFVRFSGCNLRCPWCDTDFDSFTLMSADDIAAEVSRLNHDKIASWVILTGGEPLLQADDSLVDTLHQNGYKVAVETNGTIVPPPSIDWVTCSPKEGSITRLRHADEVKVVYTGLSPEHWRDFITADHWLLQPLDDNAKDNAGETAEYILAHKGWRLSLQVHKIIGIK